MSRSQNPTAYLDLTGAGDRAGRWQQAAASIGIHLRPQTLPSVPVHEAEPSAMGVMFAVAGVGDEPANVAVFGEAKVRCVTHPPLAALAHRPLSAAEHEELRLAGVAHVFEELAFKEPDRAALLALTRSYQWTRWQLEPNLLPDLLQMLGQQRKARAVTVECPHGVPMSAQPFKLAEGRALCLSGDPTGCEGWCGRVHLRGGAVVHAETPGAVGREALMQLLALTSGTIRLQEVFLAPAQDSITGSLQSTLLNAIVLLDESNTSNHVAAPAEVPAAAAPTAAADRFATPPPRAPEQTPRPLKPKVPAPPKLGRIHLLPDTPNAGPTSAIQAPPLRNPAANSPTTTAKEDNMQLQKLLGLGPGLKAASRCDAEGRVLECVGDNDAEELSAVAAMCHRSVSDAGELLAMGEPRGWAFTGESVALYCVGGDADSLVAVTGKASKNIHTVLRKLIGAVNPSKAR